MRIAIISDIHGNFQALQAVWHDIELADVAKVICLGDLINYGAQSEEVVEFIAQNEIDTIIGNHELALLFDEHLKSFGALARISMKICRASLSLQSVDFIKKLPLNIIFGNICFAHALPPDNAEKYMYMCTDKEVAESVKPNLFNLAFVGHTHDVMLYSIDYQNVVREKFPKGITKLSPYVKYIVNVGSVGQPRDANKDAKYVIYDTIENSVELKYVKYDYKKAAELIRKAGLPDYNVERLF